MKQNEDFDLHAFLPYLLNQAAEAASVNFGEVYKARYGMLRTEWRVLAHLGRYGAMTASEIGRKARVHKTKISRAVSALTARRFVRREEVAEDRRNARLTLTRAGASAYRDLAGVAEEYDRRLSEQFSADEQKALRACLRRLASLESERR